MFGFFKRNFGIIILILVLLLAGGILSIHVLSKTQGYETTTATMEYFGSCYKEDNLCRATYKYEVDDVEYLAITKENASGEKIFGDTVLIRYNPKNPNESMLVMGIPYLFVFSLILFIFVVFKEIINNCFMKVKSV